MSSSVSSTASSSSPEPAYSSVSVPRPKPLTRSTFRLDAPFAIATAADTPMEEWSQSMKNWWEDLLGVTPSPKSPQIVAPKDSVVIGGRYVLCNQTLGRGAGTSIELAKDLKLNKLVVLKLFTIPDDKLTPQKHAMLLTLQKKVASDEARIMSLVSCHPNVIRLLDTSLDKNGVPCLVMELINGSELFSIVSETGKLEEPQARRYFRQLVDAVGYIHANGLIHNDLKLENTLVEDEIVKIIDFGLSVTCLSTEALDGSAPVVDNKLFRSKAVAPQHVGEFTTEYASPECLTGEFPLSFKSDVWSCGVILYAMVCGFLPFDGPTPKATRNRIISNPVTFYSPFDKSLSLPLRELIVGMLTKNPYDRMSIEQIKEHEWYLGED